MPRAAAFREAHERTHALHVHDATAQPHSRAACALHIQLAFRQERRECRWHTHVCASREHGCEKRNMNEPLGRYDQHVCFSGFRYVCVFLGIYVCVFLGMSVHGSVLRATIQHNKSQETHLPFAYQEAPHDTD